MKYFDAHTHVQFVAFDEDREEVFARAREVSVGMNLVGTQLDTSTFGVKCAEGHDGVWATIGLHPIHTSKSFHDEKELGEGGKAFTSRGEVFDMNAYEALAQSPKVIAIGECGLYYFRLEEHTKKIQREVFEAQIALAQKVHKPLMLHIRNAYDDALEIVRAHPGVVGDVHFFAGDWSVAKQFLDLGFTLSFTGVITFTHDYDEVVRNTPLNMILTETDAPYVTPMPHRGKRNEPMYIPHIVKKIAELQGVPSEHAQAQILENARRVFAL